MNKKLGMDFFSRDALEAAPELVGKILVHRLPDGTELRERIAETEAYRGEEDLACHASRGRTPRTELLYGKSGVIYIYLCYGMHWLMNVITGDEGNPQGILIRAGEVHNGPAKLTKALMLNGECNGQPIYDNPDIWIEDDGFAPEIKTAPRVGIDYAGEYWKNVEWRFIAEVR
ncbi:MAG: DNA-3-methyladenine glycosylase [Ruminococcus sp.]|nr:DNA-3-methyladenine glycosylase [Ruminococcus sp.]MCD7890879.1 DNA-3-methyladenine glycosylase [Ruminococcus sp.]